MKSCSTEVYLFEMAKPSPRKQIIFMLFILKHFIRNLLFPKKTKELLVSVININRTIILFDFKFEHIMVGVQRLFHMLYIVKLDFTFVNFLIVYIRISILSTSLILPVTERFSTVLLSLKSAIWGVVTLGFWWLFSKISANLFRFTFLSSFFFILAFTTKRFS